MKRVILLLAILGAFLTAGVASAGIVDQQQTTVGNSETASVTLTSPLAATTEYAVGAWSSATIASPVTISYVVSCVHAGNSTAATFAVVAGRTVNSLGDGVVIFRPSKLIAGPWYGWDTCSTTVTVSQEGNGTEDHSLVAWLASAA